MVLAQDVRDKVGFLTGGSEMEALVRDHDWSATPLGPIDHWSPQLRTTVQLVLASPFPTVLAWGPAFIALYNDAYRELLGDKPLALGRPLLDVWAEVRDELGALIRRAFAGEAIRTEGAPFMVRRHGRLEQGFFDYGLSPVRDEAGAIVGVLSVAVETTGRVATAAELRASEARYRHIVEGADDFAIITQDAAGIITSWNAGAERLLGFDEDEVIGRSADIFFTPEDRARGAPRQEMRRAEREGRAVNERWHMRKDGSRFWGSGLMMRLDQGGGFLKMFRDRTAEHEAEARRGALADLGDALRDLHDPTDIAYAAAEVLGRALGVRRVGYAAIDHDTETLHVARDWAAPGVTMLGGVLSLRDFGSFVDSMKRGESTVISDVRDDSRTAQMAAALERHDVRAFVNTPVVEHGRLVAVF